MVIAVVLKGILPFDAYNVLMHHQHILLERSRQRHRVLLLALVFLLIL